MMDIMDRSLTKDPSQLKAKLTMHWLMIEPQMNGSLAIAKVIMASHYTPEGHPPLNVLSRSNEVWVIMWYTDPKCHHKLTLNYQAIESLFQEVKFYCAELHVDSDKGARISELGKT